MPRDNTVHTTVVDFDTRDAQHIDYSPKPATRLLPDAGRSFDTSYENVFGARTLRTLIILKLDVLAVDKFLEGDVLDGRTMKKVLGVILTLNEAETFVLDETCDLALHCSVPFDFKLGLKLCQGLFDG